jgi:hypothetical protein
LVILLRFGGALLGSAFFAMFLPDSWMAQTHRQLGLGEYPAAPLTSYLTRSVSALYAFHGGLLLALSTDVRRFRPLLRFVGWATVGFGLALMAIDFHASLPLWWQLAEGPWVVAIGCALAWLVGKLPSREAPTVTPSSGDRWRVDDSAAGRS